MFCSPWGGGWGSWCSVPRGGMEGELLGRMGLHLQSLCVTDVGVVLVGALLGWGPVLRGGARPLLRGRGMQQHHLVGAVGARVMRARESPRHMSLSQLAQ